MTPGVRERYIPTLRRWAEALSAENAIRATGEVPRPDVCFPLRRVATGGETIIVPVEHGLGIDLSDEIAGDDQLAGMWRIVGTHVVLVNDLFSFRKEYFTGDGLNLITSLLYHEKMTLQSAVDKVQDMIGKAGEDFAAACRDIRVRYARHPRGKDVERYLEALGYMISGNVAWSYESPRYHGVGHFWDGLPPDTIVLLQDETEFGIEIGSE
jgi:hypothetical protein